MSEPMKEIVANTRDHHVPRMYLERFVRHRSSGPQVTAMTPDLRVRFNTSVNDVAVERGFYWGTDVDGVPHHHIEQFLTALEGPADETLPLAPKSDEEAITTVQQMSVELAHRREQFLRLSG